jgi:hypothetical protein
MKPALFLLSLLLFTILFSCQHSTQQADNPFVIGDTLSVTGLSGDSAKLVKTASLNIKVQDVTQSIRAVSSLTKSFSGMIHDQSLEMAEREKKELKRSEDSLLIIATIVPHASIAVRMPSEHLEAFMFGVADLGYFTGSSNLHIDDKSLVYLENALKQKNRTEVLTMQGIQKSSSSKNLQVIQLQDEAIEQQIANRAIDADVRYSTINLQLFQNPVVRRDVIANYNLADYRLPFATLLRNALYDGWQYFLAFVLVLANLWMFLLGSIVILVFYRYFKQKGKLIGF